MFWLVLLALCMTATAQVSREYDVKAVFLFNFVQFVEWPSTAFDSPDSPFVIGILGNDPFHGAIDDVVKSEKIGRRRVMVERYRRIEDIERCHILFISLSEEWRLLRILTLLKDRPILTVSEIENFARQGGMVRFYTEKSKVRLRINNDAARTAGLNVSTKLLRIADVVTTNSLR